MDILDSPGGEPGCSSSNQTVSREQTFPGNFTTSSAISARHIADRNLLSQNLSFKLRRRQSLGNAKSRGQEVSPENLSSQRPWAMSSQKTSYTETKDDRLRIEKSEMFPSIETSANHFQKSTSPSSSSALPIDWDAMSDVLPSATTCHKAAMDAVQFKNKDGIFVHTDKYAAGRFTKHCNCSPTPSGETILISPDGFSVRPARTTGSRSTRHVAWGVNTVAEPLGKGENVRKVGVVTPASYSTRSDNSSCISRPRFMSKKNKVDHINVKWKISEAEKRKCAETEKRLGRLSKTVLPVTIGVDYRGTSVSKTKWLVPTLPKHDPSQVWFKCLNFVKQNTTVW